MVVPKLRKLSRARHFDISFSGIVLRIRRGVFMSHQKIVSAGHRKSEPDWRSTRDAEGREKFLKSEAGRRFLRAQLRHYLRVKGFASRGLIVLS